MEVLNQEYVKKLFNYKHGALYWKIKLTNFSRIDIGDRAGCYHKGQDRYVIGLLGHQYNIARIIFLWHKGWLPRVVDHENHVTTDDYIENLRAASYNDNNRNRTSQKNSSSKYLGVHFVKSRNNYRVQIRNNGVPKFLGNFKSEEQAALVYNRAAVMYHGEFANLNIIIPIFVHKKSLHNLGL